eukprot:1156183-Pelagomonas_calceolata.AAC.9
MEALKGALAQGDALAERLGSGDLTGKAVSAQRCSNKKAQGLPCFKEGSVRDQEAEAHTSPSPLSFKAINNEKMLVPVPNNANVAP